MIEELQKSYRKLLINKAEIENWEIIIDTDIDKKLYDLLIQTPINQKKQHKKINIEKLFFIVFGKNTLNNFIQNGWEKKEIYSKSISKTQKKKKK